MELAGFPAPSIGDTMPVTKTCEICGKLFDVPPTRAKTAKACSHECAVKVRIASRAKRYALVACRQCGKKFEVPFAHLGRRVFCSPVCKEASPETRRRKADLTGGRNAAWKGGETKRVDGYVYERAGGHPRAHIGYVLQHRLVIERALLRFNLDHPFLGDLGGGHFGLRPEVHVHHVNQDRGDNRFENLIACTNAAHQQIHAGRKPAAGSYWPEPENGTFIQGEP